MWGSNKESDMKWKSNGLVAALVLAALPFGAAQAGDSFVGRVTAVKSANLITMTQGDTTYEVRINGIVVDERAAFALEARRALAALVLDKTVRLRFDGLSDGLMTGRIKIGGIGKPEETVKDLGVEMVRAGVVRADANYSKYKYGQMAQAEAEARQNRRGVWR
jgi:endonuclease YncB( thermonuclease family)